MFRIQCDCSERHEVTLPLRFFMNAFSDSFTPVRLTVKLCTRLIRYALYDAHIFSFLSSSNIQCVGNAAIGLASINLSLRTYALHFSLIFTLLTVPSAWLCGQKNGTLSLLWF